MSRFQDVSIPAQGRFPAALATAHLDTLKTYVRMRMVVLIGFANAIGLIMVPVVNSGIGQGAPTIALLRFDAKDFPILMGLCIEMAMGLGGFVLYVAVFKLQHLRARLAPGALAGAFMRATWYEFAGWAVILLINGLWWGERLFSA